MRAGWLRGRVAETTKQAGDVVVVFGRRGRAPRDPVEDIRVGAIEQRLVAVKLTLVKSGQVRIGEAAENQITLARPAMPGSKQQALAANLGR